jgi:NAD kinase
MQHWAVILLVMVGGGALVLLAYAVLRNFSAPEDEHSYGFRAEQLAYMQDVRQQNLDALCAEMMRGYPKSVSIRRVNVAVMTEQLRRNIRP